MPGVLSIHHLHAWSLTTGKNILSTHVLIEDFASGEPLFQAVQTMLKTEFDIYFSTIQVETEVCEAIEAADHIDFLRGASDTSLDQQTQLAGHAEHAVQDDPDQHEGHEEHDEHKGH